jgi:hypothetical protein
MAKALPFVLAGVGLLVVGGVAFAASSSGGSSGGTAPSATPTDATAALTAIKTGDSTRMRNAALVMSTRSPLIAAGLAQGAQQLDDAKKSATDVAALVRGAYASADVTNMQGIASILQTRGRNDLALPLVAFAGYVGWLKAGAPAGVPTTTFEPHIATGTTPAVPSIPGIPGIPTPSIVVPSANLPASDVLTPEQAAEIAATIATKDPSKIRALAGKYAAAGKQDVADALNAAANQIEAINAGIKPTVTDGTVVPAGGTSPNANNPTDLPGKLLAGKVAIAFRTAVKNKTTGVVTPSTAVELARQFQTAEKLTRLDGAYGSETALCLAEKYGIVPPKPLYWGKRGGDYKTLVADQKLYKQRLAAIAAKDPQRADEWAKAMAV